MAIITKFSETKAPTSKIDGTIFNNQGTPAPKDSFKYEAQPQLADHVKENEELEKKSFIGSDAVEPPKLFPDIEASWSPKLSGAAPAESRHLPDSIDQEQAYITIDAFENLFSTNQDVFEAIKKNMQEFGYDRDRPVTLGTGPWTSKPVVIDGHTRLKAALELGVEPTFVTKTFETEDDAFEYVVHEHKNRRNLSDAEKVALVTAVDKRFKKGGDTRAIATPVANGKSARSSDITAEKTGISRGTVDKIRTITAENTPPDIKEAVKTGKTSINKAYSQTIKAKGTSKGRKQKPSKDSLATPVITQSLTTKSPPTCEEVRTAIARAKSLNPEYSLDKMLEADVYFRKYNEAWGSMMRRVEALPESFQNTFFIRFKKLVVRIEREARDTAKWKWDRQLLLGLDLVDLKTEN